MRGMKRYAEANKELVRKGKQKDRVVFMGNCITEGWEANDAAFFEDNGYVGRGIGGQTSSHFLLRFREDVIKMCIRDRPEAPSAFQVPLTLELMPCPLTVVPISSPSSSVPSKLRVKVLF